MNEPIERATEVLRRARRDNPDLVVADESTLNLYAFRFEQQKKDAETLALRMERICGNALGLAISLVGAIALVVMLVMGVLVAAVVGYSSTSAGSIKNYRVQRAERYAGDAAIKAATTWVANTYNVARDGTLGLRVCATPRPPI